MLDLDAIRERIRSRYEAKGLPATGVWHKDHGMGQTTVRNFLDGMTQSLTLDTVQKLEAPLGVSAEWIIFGDAGVGLNAERIQQMVSEALDELQPGMSIAEIRQNVSAVLHDQLSLALAGAVHPGPAALQTPPVEAGLPQPPTN